MLYRHLTLDEMNLDAIRHHIEGIRDRRLVRVVEYHEKRGKKLQGMSQKNAVKLSHEFDMLSKELARLDKALDATDKRMISILALQQEGQSLQSDQAAIEEIVSERE